MSNKDKNTDESKKKKVDESKSKKKGESKDNTVDESNSKNADGVKNKNLDESISKNADESKNKDVDETKDKNIDEAETKDNNNRQINIGAIKSALIPNQDISTPIGTQTQGPTLQGKGVKSTSKPVTDTSQSNDTSDSDTSASSTDTSTITTTSESDAIAIELRDTLVRVDETLRSINSIRTELCKLPLDLCQRQYFDYEVSPLLATLNNLSAASVNLAASVNVLTTSPIVPRKKGKIKSTINLVYNINSKCNDIYKELEERIDILIGKKC